MSRESEGICPDCGGDLYLIDNELHCDTCESVRNIVTDKVTSQKVTYEDIRS